VFVGARPKARMRDWRCWGRSLKVVVATGNIDKGAGCVHPAPVIQLVLQPPAAALQTVVGLLM
jgi:hypothetical protein